MDYYSLFWRPEEISTINEPRGAFTCQSSTLTAFVDSDPFHGLLLTVLGPEAIFIDVEPHCAITCRSSTLTVLADFGPFRGLILTVLGARSDFHD